MSLRGFKIMEQMFESSVRSLQCLSPYTPPPPRSLRQIKQRKRTPLAAVFGSLDRDKSPKMIHFLQEELESIEKGDITFQVRTTCYIIRR
ncbi:uncharacterized protein TNIN_487821 [Trichonephila inaurata madagascariensis]|uniref:Uncharacterized protein n=1 Tax=Trichonephila inaurata madagascariensis TaxID=2747483 RepID=A0A8X6WVJ3_9ARAC|nr:uncharacterized protein TNIN_487821 [Trichonephila inaurata madagascariensis]